MVSSARINSEGVSSYLRQLGPHRQLSREEEYDLSRRIRRGDAAAKQLLAVSNLPFVVSVARRYAKGGQRLDDLVQEGNVGLMKAIEHYDAKKNVRFATYAVWWIRAYITRYLKDNRGQVRGGEAERESMRDFSLDAMVGDDGETSFLDRLEDGGPTPDLTFAQRETSQDVKDALSRVKKRIGDMGWDIVQERLTQDEPRTLEELGRRWGVSRERVRQVELRTKAFLARYLSSIEEGAENDEADLALADVA